MPNNIFVTLRQQYKNNDINTDSRDKINNNSKIVATGFACVVSVWTTRPFILNCPNPNFPNIFHNFWLPSKLFTFRQYFAIFGQHLWQNNASGKMIFSRGTSIKLASLKSWRMHQLLKRQELLVNFTPRRSARCSRRRRIFTKALKVSSFPD